MGAKAILRTLEMSGIIGLPGWGDIHLTANGNRLWVRRIAGETDRTAVLLLHGWSASADLNWRTTYGHLDGYQVIAPDHPGHGHSPVDDTMFSLEDCADSYAELARRWGIATLIPVGYSMGGPIAMLMARRHPDLVSGVVLAATAAHFGRNAFERTALRYVGALGRVSRDVLHAAETHGHLEGNRYVTLAEKLSEIAEAGTGLAGFDARGWLDLLDVPVVQLCTSKDHLVPLADQLETACALNAATRRVDADHDAALVHPGFGRVVREAVETILAVGYTPARAPALAGAL